MSTVFKYLDYKEYIRDLIALKATRGYQVKIARAADCQPAYLSRILSTHVHFTPEQAVGVCDFLSFTENETDYFLELVNYARAGTPRLQARLKKNLQRIKQLNEQLSRRYATTELDDHFKVGVYYSSWHWAAIHIATGIPQLQTPKAIAERLGIPEKIVQSSLETLKKMNLVRMTGNRWEYGSGQLHLPQESTMTAINHSHWRNRALIDCQNVSTGGLHYSAVFSHGVKDFEKIKELLLEAIDASRKMIRPSPDEEMSAICIDHFTL